MLQGRDRDMFMMLLAFTLLASGGKCRFVQQYIPMYSRGRHHVKFYYSECDCLQFLTLQLTKCLVMWSQICLTWLINNNLNNCNFKCEEVFTDTVCLVLMFIYLFIFYLLISTVNYVGRQIYCVLCQFELTVTGFILVARLILCNWKSSHWPEHCLKLTAAFAR